MASPSNNYDSEDELNIGFDKVVQAPLRLTNVRLPLMDSDGDSKSSLIVDDMVEVDQLKREELHKQQRDEEDICIDDNDTSESLEEEPMEHDGNREEEKPMEHDGNGEEEPMEHDGNGEEKDPMEHDSNREEEEPMEHDGNGEKEPMEHDGNGEEEKQMEHDGNGEKEEPMEHDGNGEKEPMEHDSNGEEEEQMEHYGNGEEEEPMERSDPKDEQEGGALHELLPPLYRTTYCLLRLHLLVPLSQQE